MNQQTVIHIPAVSRKITGGDSFFCLGSCFSSEIGAYAARRGLQAHVNPLGTMYNIYSLYHALKLLFFPVKFEKKDLLYQHDLYFSPFHSSLFSHRTAEIALEKINSTLREAQEGIRGASVFIITPGTSVVYSCKDHIVANCHRLPHSLFTKRLLTRAETADYLEKSITLIRNEIKDAKIIITLSPVRHTPTDLTENAYSKAVLRCALQAEADKGRADYFPAYEIVNDQLRNYSYYKKDMVHLKKKSVLYIMERFEEAFFDSSLSNVCKRYEAVKKMVRHRPKTPGSRSYLTFLQTVTGKIKNLEKEGTCNVTALQLKTAYRLCKHYHHAPETTGLIKSLFAADKQLSKLFTELCELLQGKRQRLNLSYTGDKGISKKVKKIAARLVRQKAMNDYFENI